MQPQVIVIQSVPMDLAEIQQPVPLMWFNKHNAGPKYTKVFLGKQEPKKDPVSGEWTLDLLQHADEQEPSIQGIFPRHLEIPRGKAAKRQRRR
jgi:hypothetical protein